MMIALMGRMNVILKTPSDISSIQVPTAKAGFKSTSKVSFDMFRFNSLMNDFRSDAVSTKPELISRQSAQDEKYSQTQEAVNRKSGSPEKSPEASAGQYSNKSDQVDRPRKDAEIQTDSDGRENIQGRNTIDDTSARPEDQTEITAGKNDQCSDDADKCIQQPAGDAAAENGLNNGLNNEEDNGQHIGLFLSDILNSDVNGLILDNSMNQGEGSPVSAVAQSGIKGESAIDLKNGNLLSHLIKGEIDNGKTPGQGANQSGITSDVTPDNLMNRLNVIQAGQTAVEGEGKNSDAINAKVPVSASALQESSAADIFSEKPEDETDDDTIENLMKVAIKPKSAEHEGTGKLREENSEINADKSDRGRIDADRKADFKGNHSRQFQDTVTESGLRDLKHNETVMYEKPPASIAENIQMGPTAKISDGPNVRSEGISSENSSNGLLNNSNTSHEGIKAGEAPKAINTPRPQAFNEVVDKITYILKGSTKMGVKVESESLGKLNINVSIEKGLVNVHIHSADKAVREYVENNIQQIVDSLSKSGVSVGGFSVGLRNNRNNESSADMNGNGRSNPVSVDRAKEREYISTASRAMHNNRLVNIFA